MRKAIENTALSVTGVLKVRKKARLFSEDLEAKKDVKELPDEDDCKQFSSSSMFLSSLTSATFSY